jgi:predicted HTH domain antitoxin
MPVKTLSIRMNEDDYRSLVSLAREEKEDVSKTVRELVGLGRTMLAIEKYKGGDASLEKSARIAGVSISKMLDIMKEHGVTANLEEEDYLRSLKTIRKVW